MSVRKDQVDAQKYVHRRVVNALLTSDADTQQNPLRTLARATIVSCLLGALIVGGFLAYGFISKGGSTDWRSEGSVVIVEETGTRYVYLDGLLHPVANLTSALLISGEGTSEDGELVTFSVSENSLATASRGAPLGILGAPDSVVAADDLLHDGWTVCTARVPTSSGGLEPTVVVMPGTPSLARPLAADSAVLVDVDGVSQLIWAGSRWDLSDVGAVLTAFNEPASAALAVGTAWADVVPAMGGQLTLPAIADRGAAAVEVGGEAALVGQVFVTEAGDRSQYYLAYADGLLAVPSSVAVLALADPLNAPLYPDRPVAARVTDTAAVNAAGPSSADPLGAQWPDSVPSIVNNTMSRSTGLCVTFGADEGRTTSVLSTVDPIDLGALGGGDAETEFAGSDRVQLSPSTGALVRAESPDGAELGTVYVITDQGVKYPLAGPAAIAALGYDGIVPDVLPRPLLDIIPTGPSLDPVAARTVVAAAGPPTTGADG